MRMFTVGKTIFYTLVIATVITVMLAIVAVQYLTYFLPQNLPALTQMSEELSTDAWGVFDPETGVLLAGENTAMQLPIASITKLFTAEAVLESARREEKTTIVYADVSAPGRAGKLWYGHNMTPYELLFPLLLESSNDAAEAIRRSLGAEYERAVKESLEPLTATRLADASGLSSGNVSTVEDLATFYASLKHRHPHLIDITKLRMYVGEYNGYVNNNPGREFRSFRGGKHGFTDEAGRTFIGTFVLKDGDELGIVLLGSDDLRKDIGTLLTYGEGLKKSSDIMAP